MSNKERDINIITLGETDVGKTSILNRIKNDTFHENENHHNLLVFLSKKDHMKKEK